MNRCAVVLIACLVWPTQPVVAQNALKNSALQISVRFDDDARVVQRIRTVDGGRAQIMAGPSRPAQKRQYIETPAGRIAQEISVVQDATPSFEVLTRVLDDSVHLQTVAGSASGRLGEWLKLGAVAVGGSAGSGTRTVWVKVDEIP